MGIINGPKTSEGLKTPNVGRLILAGPNETPAVNILIPLEEYKELLIIKGKYEESMTGYKVAVYSEKTNQFMGHFDTGIKMGV